MHSLLALLFGHYQRVGEKSGSLIAKCSTLFTSYLLTMPVCHLVLSKLYTEGFLELFLSKQSPTAAENDALRVHQKSFSLAAKQ